MTLIALDPDDLHFIVTCGATSCPDHPGETAHNCRCCAADRKAETA